MHPHRCRLSIGAGRALAVLGILLTGVPVALSQQDQKAQGAHSHEGQAAHGSTTGAGEALQPVVGAHELMELFNQPLYEELQETLKQAPSDDEQWEKIARLGSKAAEIANLVALRNSERPEEWRRHAADLQQAGIALSDAAEQKDFEAARQAYRSLVERCNACHNEFAPEHAPNLEP